MIYVSDPFDINQGENVYPVPLGQDNAVLFDVVKVDGTFSAAVLGVVYQLTPDTPWRELVPAVRLTASVPYTTYPASVFGSPARVGLKVITKEGSAGNVRITCTTSKVQ